MAFFKTLFTGHSYRLGAFFDKDGREVIFFLKNQVLLSNLTGGHRQCIHFFSPPKKET